MANFIYTKAKELILDGDIDFLVDNISVLLVSSLYSPNQVSDEYVSNVPSSSIKYRTGQLQDVSTDGGVLDADDLEVNDYSGAAFNALILYKNTGSDATSALIAYIHESPGLPFAGTSSTVPIYIVWNNGITKIISLNETANGTNTILNGAVAPSNSIGNDGDFYIQTSPYTIFGPKASGSWPAGVSIVGPTGPIVPVEVRSDFVSPYSYMGVADSGSSEAASVWKITRIDVTQATPSTSVATSVAWSNRLAATYI